VVGEEDRVAGGLGELFARAATLTVSRSDGTRVCLRAGWSGDHQTGVDADADPKFTGESSATRR